MSKMISIWGSPCSGKTSFALKLALSIYENSKASVFVLFCGYQVPTLPQIFPNHRINEMYSVGVPLSQTEISQSEIYKNTVTVKQKSNMGFLGYIDSENRFSYPEYDKSKSIEFLSALKSMADYIIIDCTSSFSDLLTVSALELSDNTIRLVTPDMKSVCYFSSQLPLYTDSKYKVSNHIVILNNTVQDVYYPVEEVKQIFKRIDFTLPFCHEIKKQEIRGELMKRLNNKKFNAVLKEVKGRVM